MIRKWLFPALVAVLSLCPGAARAQFIGYTSPQTVQITLASNLACTGSAQTFTTGQTFGGVLFSNIGQTQHYISILPSAAVVGIQGEIDGIDNAGNVFRISEIFHIGALTVIPPLVKGSGYYPKIQVSVTCATAAGTFTLNYSGASATFNENSGAYMDGQMDKALLSGAAANATKSVQTQPPFFNTTGSLDFFSAGGPPAGSSISVFCSGQIALPTQTFNLTTAGGTQSFSPSPEICPLMTVTFNSGGASASTYSLEYIFSIPGTTLGASSASALSSAFNTSAILVEKGARWDVLSAPAAGAQATASKAAGTTGIRHVADCVSYSAGAIAAPVATTLQINLRDGASGAGTVIWTKTVTIPATAAPHYDGNFCGLNLIGSSATAMTLEFSALLASESESVTLTGYDVQ